MSDLPERCRAAYERLIGPLRETARSLGYALAVHGSLARDIDLVAVPWTEGAVQPGDLAAGIQSTIKKILRPSAGFLDPLEAADDYFLAGCPGGRPHGRRVWSFHLGGGPYIDLSVMPTKEDE